jgi:hypothetical protein
MIGMSDFWFDGELTMFEVGNLVLTNYNNVGVCVVIKERIHFAIYNIRQFATPTNEILIFKRLRLIDTDKFARAIRNIVIGEPDTEEEKKIVNLFSDWYYGKESEKNKTRLEYDISWALTRLKKYAMKQEKYQQIQNIAFQNTEQNIEQNIEQNTRLLVKVLQKTEDDYTTVSYKIKSEINKRFEDFCSKQNKLPSAMIEGLMEVLLEEAL